ncbi:hypothetical protein [Sinomonas susongensis]|uniref:hypothetical protein n=1 Tax=Sinomonas susongensis TaxID=1324851 RepID=UPI001BB13A40|nr:hypothetical protein [Sinomonas susongensis]
MCAIIVGVLAFIVASALANFLHISVLWFVVGVPVAIFGYVLYDVFWDPTARKQRRELYK